MLRPQELNSSISPSTVVLGFVCLGVGAVLLGQKAVFEYLKSCAVFYLNVVYRHCVVHLFPCLFADYTVKCATLMLWSSKTDCLLFNKVS